LASRTAVCVAFCALLILALTRPARYESFNRC
jgi:hypothetical protein